MSEIVAFKSGAPVAHPGSPDAEVIAQLRELLTMAEAGEIVGIAWAASHFDRASTNGNSGVASRSMLGSLHMLAHHLAGHMNA